MTTLVLLFLIGTSSYLQDTRTCIKAWVSSNFRQIQPLTTELSVLERLNNQYIFEHSSAFIFDLTGNKDNFKVSDELRSKLSLTH